MYAILSFARRGVDRHAEEIVNSNQQFEPLVYAKRINNADYVNIKMTARFLPIFFLFKYNTPSFSPFI